MRISMAASYGSLFRHCLSCTSLSARTNIMPGMLQVRFRKRRDVVPLRAPSKIYNVRERTKQSDDERQILHKEYCHYRTQMKSLILFLKSRKVPIVSAMKENKISSVDEEDDLAKALAMNDQWNAEIAQQRQERLAQEQEIKSGLLDDQITRDLADLESQQRLAKEVLQRKHEKRQSSIDLTNLDEELDKFLDGPVTDHNFAITRSGEKYTE